MKIVDLTIPAHQAILVEEIKRAKKLLSEISEAPELDSNKIATWLTDNEGKVGEFTHNGQTWNTIVKNVESGRMSQYYLKTLIDALDHIEGVAIDDADFYKSPKTAMPPLSNKFSVNPYKTSIGKPSGKWTGD
jgi:hypothetical protein